MENADDLANALRDMSTDSPRETYPPEIESKYDVLREAFEKFDLSSLAEGTVIFFAIP